jgi:RNA polymerase sigma factor (sigma-70 family)
VALTVRNPVTTVALPCDGQLFGWERRLPGNVYVVDDDASLRNALKRLLNKEGYNVETYPSAQELLDRLPDETQPGCILSDVRMPGLSGPDLQTQLNQLGSTLPIIFLTGHADVGTTVRTVKAGAHDFLTKPVSSDQLLPAINRALEGHEASWAAKTAIDRLRALVATLTPRERQVFELVILGKTNKHIARELGSTERTVKAHRQKVMEKTRVQSLAELVSLAERVGMLPR